MSRREPHRATLRWTVDGIEENVARIVEDGSRTIHVPRSLLPDDVREGDILVVVRETGDAAGVRLEITIDRAATDAARLAAQAASNTIMLIGRRDEGGDVVL